MNTPLLNELPKTWLEQKLKERKVSWVAFGLLIVVFLFLGGLWAADCGFSFFNRAAL